MVVLLFQARGRHGDVPNFAVRPTKNVHTKKKKEKRERQKERRKKWYVYCPMLPPTPFPHTPLALM